MPYSVPIDRRHPGAIVLLLDQSASMSDDYGGGQGSKAFVLARLVNRLIRNLVLQCERGNEILDYYQIGVVGYGGDEARPAFGDELAGQYFVPISAIADYPLRLEPEALPEQPEVTIDRPVWIEARAGGATPMAEAIDLAGSLLVDWANAHLDSGPPVVINITDGMATGGDPVPISQQLRMIRTSDGELLLFNIHISEVVGQGIEFPATVGGLPDHYAETLFSMSSELTPYMRTVAENMGKPLEPGSRGFMFNADPSQLAQFLDIGTRVKHDLDR